LCAGQRAGGAAAFTASVPPSRSGASVAPAATSGASNIRQSPPLSAAAVLAVAAALLDADVRSSSLCSSCFVISRQKPPRGQAPRTARAAPHRARKGLQTLSFPPPPRTKWTRRVPHPVLTGHVSSPRRCSRHGETTLETRRRRFLAPISLSVSADPSSRAAVPSSAPVLLIDPYTYVSSLGGSDGSW